VSAATIAVDVLLALGVAAELLCCLGVLLMRNAYARLHYSAAASTLGPLLIASAIVVEERLTNPGVKALLVAGFLFCLNPVLTIATARAARVREAR
jgi:monovalent cation/proton antiporter MnhG/PhaG subunit